MRIAFRTDASDAIGTGHLMRCLALADALAGAGHECCFALRNHPSCPATIVTERGHSLATLPERDEVHDGVLAHSAWLGTTQERDARDTTAAIGAGWDWIVSDHYALDERWELAIGESAGRIMAIDDLADRRHQCNLLLDQNLQEPGRYTALVTAGCQLLVGPRYALLRPEFASFGRALGCRPLDEAARILVYFGGVDADGASLRALRGIELAKMPQAVDLVIGPLNPHRKQLRALCDRLDRVTIHEGHVDMASLMASAALAIGAAGMTAWERCCMALPSLILTIAANQRPGASALAARSAALWLGDSDSVSASEIAAALSRLVDQPALLEAVAHNGRQICDGGGTARVVAAMATPPITLRTATSADCDTIYRWRNHPETRRYVHDPCEIALGPHREWFTRVIKDPDRRLWIGERNGTDIGVIRFDRTSGTALVSVYLVPGMSGTGLGTSLIAAGCREILREWDNLTAIDAEIIAANTASARAFAKANFHPQAEGRWQLTVVNAGEQ